MSQFNPYDFPTPPAPGGDPRNPLYVVPVSGTAGGYASSAAFVQAISTPTSGSDLALVQDNPQGFETGSVSKAGPGRLYFAFGYNAGQSVRSFQVFNSSSFPTNGARPIIDVPLQPGSQFSLDLTPFGDYFSTGITWMFSTTSGSLTAVTSNDAWVNVRVL